MIGWAGMTSTRRLSQMKGTAFGTSEPPVGTSSRGHAMPLLRRQLLAVALRVEVGGPEEESRAAERPVEAVLGGEEPRAAAPTAEE